MIIKSGSEALTEKMITILPKVKEKYKTAIGNGGESKLDTLFREFGMTKDEIRCARKLMNAIFLHGSIVGGETVRF